VTLGVWLFRARVELTSDAVCGVRLREGKSLRRERSYEFEDWKRCETANQMIEFIGGDNVCSLEDFPKGDKAPQEWANTCKTREIKRCLIRASRIHDDTTLPQVR
jgi:hypothetical protein